jgi:hypothetical protein
MLCMRFPTGGFVLHKIMLNGHKYSAWFGEDGTLFDAELVMRNGNVRNVSERQTEIRRQLTVIGKRLALIDTNQ